MYKQEITALSKIDRFLIHRMQISFYQYGYGIERVNHVTILIFSVYNTALHYEIQKII